MKSTWRTKATTLIAKVLVPRSAKRRDPWVSTSGHRREVNRAAARRPHPHADLIEAIDDAHRGRPRWLPRTRGWLDR